MKDSKKTIRRFFSVFMVIVMLLSAAPLNGFVGLDLVTIANAVDVVETGKCGKNVTYTLYSDGNLIISGTGEMTNYSSKNPFSSMPKLISITIEDGVLSIGSYAFEKCTGLTSITIPDGVKSVGQAAFRGCTSLLNINIPSSVLKIGSDAFQNCVSLTSIIVDSNNPYYSSDNYGVLYNKDKSELISYPAGNLRTTFTIPDSVNEVDSYSFYNVCNLINIIIPNSVTEIGGFAFLGCFSLTEIIVLPENQNYCSDEYGVLYSKDKSELISYPAGNARTTFTIPNSVTVIDWGAFYGSCNLKSVIIPSSVTQIGFFAFSSCTSLTSITIPNSVTFIDNSVFDNCVGLTNITVDSGNQNFSSDSYGVLYNKDKTALVKYPIGNTRTFFQIPNSVVYIDQNAFYGCTSLTNITIPNSVTDIWPAAFYGCTSLTNITIPNSVTGIGSETFADCTGLTSITIPDSVTSIGGNVISGCTNLESVYIGSGINSLKPFDFANSEFNKLKTIKIGGVERLVGDVLYGCPNLTRLIIGEGVKTFDLDMYRIRKLEEIIVESENPYYSSDNNGVLYNKDKSRLICYPIGNTRTSFEIPNSVTSIGNCAFENCICLTNVTIPDSVTVVGQRAFSHCTGLTEINIPSSVLDIEIDAFWDCTGLLDLIIPSGVTKIDEGAFADCVGLKNISISDTVITISYDVFEGCTGIENISVSEKNPNYCSDINGVLYNKDKTILIQYPVGNIRNSFTIPNSVNGFGWCAFNDCTDLTNITIPNSVTSINALVFSGCIGLINITIPDSVKSIGYGAFSLCASLTDVYYNGTQAEWEEVSIGSNNSYLLNATIHYTVHEHTETTETINATCTQDGYTRTYCSECNETINNIVIPALSHSFGEWTVTTPATVENEGVESRECLRCGHIETRPIERLVGNLPELIVSNVKAKAGQSFDVTINIENNPGIVATKLNISYDSSVLTLNSVTDGGLLGTNTFMAGKNITSNPYSVIWEDSLSTENYSEDGTILTLNFTVKDEAPVGTTPITVTYDTGSTFNRDLSYVQLNVVNGEVEITDRTPGDADGNGEITLMDVAFIKRYIAGDYGVVIDESNADVNGDGIVNLMDVALIKRYLAGGWDVVLQ